MLSKILRPMSETEQSSVGYDVFSGTLHPINSRIFITSISQ